MMNEAHKELLASAKDFLVKLEAFKEDDCVEKWNEYCEAEKRLDAAITASEKELPAPAAR
jgi:hypothetical protein